MLLLIAGMFPDSTQAICVSCPAGHYCTDPRQPPFLCSNGTYTLAGVNIECTICPQGYACPRQDSLPQLCTPGTHAPVGSVECLACPAGSSCSNGSTPIPCLFGDYSVEGG